jgi:hypothetical protein
MARSINRCAATIFIPAISGTSDGDFTVLLKDLSTGRVENIPVTADLLTLTIPVDEIEFMTGHTYEVRVYENGDFNEERELTIGVTSGCCISFQVMDTGEVDTAEILSLDTCE